MKILTDSEYSALLSKSSTSEVTEANRLHKIELDRVKAEYEEDSKDKARRIKRLEEDSKIAIDRVKAEQDLVVQKATKTLEDKVQKLTIESECARDTMAWLDENGVPGKVLHMRKNGDDRADYIVKKEIYEANIKGKYNVIFVLDDRDQVVRMWREEGLKCLQVAEGNF